MNRTIGLVWLVQCACGRLAFAGASMDHLHDVVDGKVLAHTCAASRPATDIVNEFLDEIGRG